MANQDEILNDDEIYHESLETEAILKVCAMKQESKIPGVNSFRKSPVACTGTSSGNGEEPFSLDTITLIVFRGSWSNGYTAFEKELHLIVLVVLLLAPLRSLFSYVRDGPSGIRTSGIYFKSALVINSVAGLYLASIHAQAISLYLLPTFTTRRGAARRCKYASSCFHTMRRTPLRFSKFSQC